MCIRDRCLVGGFTSPEMVQQATDRVDTAPITPRQGEAPVIPGGPGGLGGPGGEDLPTADTKSATPEQKADAIRKNNELIEAEDGKFEPPTGTTTNSMAEAGAENVKKDPKMANEAMAGLKNVFGDLFNKKELMRAAVLMVGARLTGATPGQALAIAGQQLSLIHISEPTRPY